MVLFNYIVMCLIFGTTFLAIKIGIDAGASPFFSAGLRFFLAGLILFCWMVGKKKASISLLLRKEMLLTGIGLTFGVFAALYWAEQHVSSGIAAVLSATGPLMILLLQSRGGRQQLSAASWGGCLVGLAGVVLLLLPGLTVTFDAWWLLGCLAVLIGEMFYAGGAVYSRQVIERFGQVSPIALNAAQMLYGGLLLLILSLLTEPVSFRPLLKPQAALSLLYLIFFGSMMGHTMFYWLVAKTNPVFPSTWLYISPLISLFLGAMFYGEPLTLLSLLGGVTIIAGIALANLESLRKFAGKRQRTTRSIRG
ncbi:DMT family transporter [Brevibacillus sp. GCM10020057]|uniref:DMT family transporter n=1 Tax=Brevibacillus sp. GCM10020057 TaxID=3317327 RepID=UPI003628DAC5